MATNKNIIKLLCPVCGTELYINKHKEIKCLCLNKFVVLGSGKDRQLVQLENVSAVKKAMQIKCKDCLDFYPHKNSNLGDCLNMDGMKRNIEGNCARICKRFRKK